MPRLAVICAVALLWAGLAVPATAQDPCARWTVRDIAAGLGVLENLEPDGDGGLLVSDGNEIRRIQPDGSSSTLMPLPGVTGLRVRGDHVYANTGSGLEDALLGAPGGTLSRVHLGTGAVEVVADGLVAPNGLVFDRDGNAYVSRDISLDIADQAQLLPDEAGISRVAPDGTVTHWAAIADTNGLAIDPTGTWMYATTSFNLQGRVIRLLMDDPTVIEAVADLLTVGTLPIKGLDDMDIDAQGILYVAALAAGEVIRLDPASGDACVIADGLLLPSSVKFGRGPGWSPDNLYAVTWAGRIHELIPPGGSPGSHELTDPERPHQGTGEPTTASLPLPDTGAGAVLTALGVLIGAGMRRRVSRTA